MATPSWAQLEYRGGRMPRSGNGEHRAAELGALGLRGIQVRTGLFGELGKTVSPPSSTLLRYISMVAVRWPPCSVFTESWK